LDSVPGWFDRADQLLFRWFLGEQVRLGQLGDLAELGTFMGKSAILIGEYVQPGETLTVVDLFESRAPEQVNRLVNDRDYGSLTRAAFEGHYLRFHAGLPNIVQGLTRAVTDRASHGSHRWVHVDASHMYEDVRQDLASARTLLNDNGVVVCDDIRSAHTPGVAAATWEAVVNDALNPIVMSRAKLYSTWSDPTEWEERLARWLPASGFAWERQRVAGRTLFRVWSVQVPPRPRLARQLAPPIVWSVARRMHR
jgi:predicted O-methyltransferase YrrM